MSLKQFPLRSACLQNGLLVVALGWRRMSLVLQAAVICPMAPKKIQGPCQWSQDKLHRERKLITVDMRWTEVSVRELLATSWWLATS